MISGSHNLTTYYAKRIIGDNAAADPQSALLQTGENITADIWLLNRTNRGASTYGIQYRYDTNGHDSISTHGGSNSTPTAWVQLDTGNVYVLGKVGIGYDPDTSDNTYKLYVSGAGYFSNTLTTDGGFYTPWIELSSATPYIDFHFGSSSSDFTSRIIESASGYLQIAGKLGINGANSTYNFYVDGTAAITDTLYLTSTTDAAGGADYRPALIIGSVTGAHLEFDPNEIMAKSNNAATATLYINNDGGLTYFGGTGSFASTLTVRAENTTNEGGQICLNADPNHSAYHAYLDVCNNYFRIHSNGQERFTLNLSADGKATVFGPFNASRIGITNTSATTGYGLSLYNGYVDGAPTYGIMFAGTATFGTHGGVTSDWATYFTMSDTTNRGWIFRRGSTNVASIDGTGKLYLGYAANANNPGIYWNPYVESASDASDVSRIIQVKSGIAGGTELQIYQANDTADVINLVTPAYIYMNSKRAFTVNDAWLRINEDRGFSSGVYFGTSTVRTDGEFWSDSVRIIDNWIGFYNAVQGGTRYGYIQANADRMYFRKENSSSQNEYFDFGSRIYTPSISVGYTNTGYTLSATNAILNGNLVFTNSGTDFRGINYGTMGDNDQWRIGGAATGSNAGYMEIATADDGTEPIYVRQYTGVFSSLTRTLTLLDGSGNSSFPGSVNIGVNLGIAQSGGASGYGISLYNGTGYVLNYGLLFAVTSYLGAHGNVSGDWATYFTMDGAKNRGWIFRHADGTRMASISTYGTLSLGHHNYQNNSLMKCDSNDRPGIGIFGNYPQIVVMSSGINNSSHGPTITLAAYDSANATSGNFKSWTFGVPGTNATFLDLGYGANQYNPHANGINNYGSAYFTRWDNGGSQINNCRLSVATRTANPGVSPSAASIEIREAARGGTDITYNAQNAPRIGFHWGNRWWMNLTYYEAELRLYNSDFSGWANMRVGEHYVQGWVRFDNWTGLYSPNNGAHFYPNNASSYGTWTIAGSRNGYYGINMNCGATMMFDGSGNGGFYSESNGVWSFYYHKGGGRLGLMGSDTGSGYTVQVNGSLYVTSTFYAPSTCYTDSNIYCHSLWANRTSGERQVGVDYGTTGTLYLYSNGSTKGIYSSSGYRVGSIIYIDSSQTIFYGNLSGSADTVDGYHASSLWRSDGGTWNNGANISCVGGGEWSFDMNSDGYWHVWSNIHGTTLACYQSSGHVNVPIHLYVGGYNNTSYGLSASTIACNGNLLVSANNATGGGLFLSDDGEFVDNNDGYCTARFTYGIIITAAKGNNTARLGLRYDGWIYFYNGHNGCYWPNCNGAHLYANDYSSYGALVTNGSRSGYYGLLTGPGSHFMCLMDTGTHKGLFQENPGIWMFYYNRDSWTVGIRTSSNWGYSVNIDGSAYASGGFYNAVWNDYAEYRASDVDEPGRVVVPSITGRARLSTERLQAGARIISDTYGMAVGATDTAKTPVGLAGRVLAYPYRNINEYKIGDAVCSAPNGTVDIMTRDEIMMYPERILGIVNEIPNYSIWESSFTAKEASDIEKPKKTTHRVEVKGRIWIDIK